MPLFDVANGNVDDRQLCSMKLILLLVMVGVTESSDMKEEIQKDVVLSRVILMMLMTLMTQVPIVLLLMLTMIVISIYLFHMNELLN